jgi:hypothetical protein
LGTKIAVIAQVLQGSNPVIRAKVKAYIERDGVDTPIEVELFDKGADPDSVRDDGIYSRYFTTFDPSADEVRYTLKCQVDSTDDSAINQGFLDARKRKNKRHGRSLPKRPSQEAPICCGSSTVNEDSILTSTGEFGRTQTGGMISIVHSDKVTYPPSTVSDLVASEFDAIQGTFAITFTSPGATLDSGIVDFYKIYYTTNQTSLLTATELDQFDFINETQLAAGSPNMTAVEAGTTVKLIVKTDGFTNGQSSVYYFRLEATVDSTSSLSNIARLYIYKITEIGPWKNHLLGPWKNHLLGPWKNHLLGPWKNHLLGPWKNLLLGPWKSLPLDLWNGQPSSFLAGNFFARLCAVFIALAAGYCSKFYVW